MGETNSIMGEKSMGRGGDMQVRSSLVCMRQTGHAVTVLWSRFLDHGGTGVMRCLARLAGRVGLGRTNG
jgi:hypothetical protein